MNQPYATVDTTTLGRAKAFIMNSTDARESARHLPRQMHEPMHTVRTTTMYKALLISDDNSISKTIRKDDEPSFVIRSSRSSTVRAWMKYGKIVAITPRGLARFQSFPDWYELPEKKTLAQTIIGNAVPPLAMEKIYKQLLEFADEE